MALRRESVQRRIKESAVVEFTNRKQWIARFQSAALEYVARRTDLMLDDDCPLRLESCGVHGTGCLRLIVGALLEHVRWDGVDPEEAAVDWLRTLLPRPIAVSPVAAAPPQGASRTGLDRQNTSP
jgi:hypothetical protein